MKTASIILNHNSSADCRKCVGFLLRQRGVEQSIILVDNASRPDDRMAVEALCEEFGLIFIPSEENRGYNAGNNIGLRHASELGCRYALIANPDMEFPNEGYLACLVERMERDGRMVVCGSDIVDLSGQHQSPMMRDGNWRSSLGWLKILNPLTIVMRKKRDTEAYDFIDHWQESHYCAKLSGCALMVRISFMREIGYFDESVFLYCEEAILSRQVERCGKKMYYTIDTQAVHRHVSSAKSDPVKRFRAWYRSRRYFISRYSGDHLFGRITAISSWWCYTALLIVTHRIRILCRRSS